MSRRHGRDQRMSRSSASASGGPSVRGFRPAVTERAIVPQKKERVEVVRIANELVEYEHLHYR